MQLCKKSPSSFMNCFDGEFLCFQLLMKCSHSAAHGKEHSSYNQTFE